MFSVEFYNRTYIISSYNIRRINFKYAENLRKLVLQAMKQKCSQVVLNLVGVRIFDNIAIETLRFLCGLCSNMNIKLIIVNIDSELCTQLQKTDFRNMFEISSPEEVSELTQL
ncbi:MAG: anti-sigma factor antagonist [Bacteroidales bacterium]|nr:anti-sigma factor antagonist [Bacteroidales bacterium]